MFTQFKLKNYRTHIDTAIELKDTTLIIGTNNSGKTNLLTGIWHFARLIAWAKDNYSKNIAPSVYFLHKHSLDRDDAPMVFNCEWKNSNGRISYVVELYPINSKCIACKEEVAININDKEIIIRHGYNPASFTLCLRSIAEWENLPLRHQALAIQFFHSLAFCYYYNLQPTFLKGLTKGNEPIDYDKVKIASDLGVEGGNLHELIKYIEKNEKETYSKFIAFLRDYVPSFHGIIVKKGKVFWQFKMGKDISNLPFFQPAYVSDGLLKAAAVALLCSLRHPPALIMIEEIENGVNIENIRSFLDWLERAIGSEKRTQFILTTHSPSVIREFSNKLDAVFNVFLNPNNYKSLITNLNDALYYDVNRGQVDGEIIERENEKPIVKIAPYRLTELFYSGTLQNP